MSDFLEKLIEDFARFPGVGPRQAKRFAYYLLTRDETKLKAFADLLLKARKMVSYCSSCGRLSVKATKSSLCPICADNSRDKSVLMVVAHDVDVESVEKSAGFKGYYFVLGGTIPVLDEKPEERIRLKELTKRLSVKEPPSEVILALDLNPEGEHTIEYLQEILSPISREKSIKISTLGRGLSTGTELQYSDPDTIKNALKNRATV
jgi:recombination protein RecR